MSTTYSREYLESVLEQVQDYLPDWLWEQLHRAAFPSSGGKARHRSPLVPNELEKLALREMRPGVLAQVDDAEITQAWHRLSQWYASAKRRGEAVEDIVNAARWVMEEARQRGIDIDEDSELAQEAGQLGKAEPGRIGGLWALAPREDVMVVPEFVSVAGGAVQRADAEDVDLIIRAERTEDDAFPISAYSIELPVRKRLDPDKRGYLHYIANPQGPHSDYVPLYDLVLRARPNFEVKVVKEDGRELAPAEKAALKPIYHYTPSKPLMAGYTDTFSAEELWNVWASKREGPFLLSPKVDGFRCILQRSGSEVSIYFEDSKTERAEQLSQLRDTLAQGPDCIIEGELQMAHGGRFLARPEILSALASKLEAEPYVFLYDLLYLDEEDVSGQSFQERLPKLESLARKLGERFVPLPQIEAKSREEFLAAAKKALDWQPWRNAHLAIEGVVAREAGMPYTFAATDDYAKFKLWCELKVQVLEVVSVTNGYVYECALKRDDDLEPLGRTFVSEEKLADKGDTLNVMVEELILYPDGTVAWGKPTPMGPDKSRGPYTVEQAVDLARRARVLKEVARKAKVVKGAGASDSIAFVGSCPTALEAVRGHALAGPDGATFRDVYLAPLRLEREDVYVTNLVPLPLGRLPSNEELELWHGHLVAELAQVRPAAVVALGKQAAEALGDAACLWLPHPSAVRRLGDSGEVRRKLARLRTILEKASREIVPGHGPKGAKIAFVGASPGRIEAARGTPLTGPAGEIFQELYLKPLGLTHDEVYKTNAVPVLLLDSTGRVREPTQDEVAEWQDWLQKDLEQAAPKLVVALGEVAAAALGEKADVVLPHPAAVMRLGATPELRRGLARLRTMLRKAVEMDEEGEGPATEQWIEEWHERLPPSGKGRFVYQHHWRGLNEDEAKNPSEEALLRTDHSVHGDLRLTSANPDELWGVTIFLGRAADNREGDRLVRLREIQDNLQVAFKPPQPKEWLRVGVNKPYLSDPGGVGATSQKFAVFNAIDSGTYRIGVAREHVVELFLEGDKLKGRYLLEYAPVGAGGRTWIVDAPESQTPYAEDHDLEEVLAELKSKGQRWLYWSNGKERPVIYDVSKARVDFVKADEEKQIVYGVVSEPDVVDTQGDVIAADTIEEACHEFMRSSRTIGLEHKAEAPAELVECYVAPTDFTWHGQQVRKGTWLVAVHVSDEALWNRIKAGEYTGFSLGGFGIRQEA